MGLPFIACAAALVLPNVGFHALPTKYRAAAPVASADFDVNSAMTRLNAAVEREDYEAANAHRWSLVDTEALLAGLAEQEAGSLDCERRLPQLKAV